MELDVDLLHELISERGLSLAQAARDMQIHKSVLCRTLSGKTKLSLRNLKKVCRYLGEDMAFRFINEER